MPQSSYRTFAVLSRGSASLAEFACLLQTAAKHDASSSRRSSACKQPANQAHLMSMLLAYASKTVAS